MKNILETVKIVETRKNKVRSIAVYDGERLISQGSEDVDFAFANRVREAVIAKGYVAQTEEGITTFTK